MRTVNLGARSKVKQSTRIASESPQHSRTKRSLPTRSQVLELTNVSLDHLPNAFGIDVGVLVKHEIAHGHDPAPLDVRMDGLRFIR